MKHWPPLFARKFYTLESSSSSPPRAAFALISTLLVVTIVAMLIASFFSTTRIERLTSHSYFHLTEAERAANAAFAIAQNRLIDAIQHPGSIVVQTSHRNYPYFFIAYPVPQKTATQPGHLRYLPLYSGGNLTLPPKDLALPQGDPRLLPQAPSDFLAQEATPTIAEPQLPSHLLPQPHLQGTTVGWEFLKKNTTNQLRYAYWIEDLEGYLDAQVVGNTQGLQQTHQRGEGTSPQEIALYTLFHPQAEEDPGTLPLQKLIQNRWLHKNNTPLLDPQGNRIPLLLTPEILKHLDFPEPQATFLASGLLESQETELIPIGLGYANEGTPKILLNDLIAQGGINGVNSIAQAIDRHLPLWAEQRRGGATKTDYLHNLAASIIDYADADSTPTSNSTYRGIDSYPFVNQWWMHTHYKDIVDNNVLIDVNHYIELWNMSDQMVSGTLSFRPVNRYTLSIAGSLPMKFHSPHYRLSPSGETSLFQKQITNMQPNEKKVLFIGTESFRFPSNFGLPPQKIQMQSNDTSTYQLYWNDQLADEPRGGIARSQYRTLYQNKNLTSQSTWSASIAGLSYSLSAQENNTFINAQLGDPRSSFLIHAPQSPISYISTVVGGRTFRESQQGKTFGEAKPSYWPDPSYDAPLGKPILKKNQRPIDIEATPNPPDLAPSHLANYPDSRLRSITELGHIFDPSQWRLYTGTSLETAQAYWQDLRSDSSPNPPQPDNRFAGGYTLRIGRPEFSRWDQPGTRASDLLGLFATQASRSSRGLLNINTASREALRALAAGIKHSTSTKLHTNNLNNPSTLYPPTSSPFDQQADRFADAIIANRPYLSRHQLASISFPTPEGKKESFFGNPNHWPQEKRPLIWRDASAEELFRRTYDLTTVRSRNFRIHITGQVLNQRGKILATSRRVYHVFIPPQPSYPRLHVLYEKKI